MKIRASIFLTVTTLFLGSISPALAADALPTRAEQVAAIQSQYMSVFDSQFIRLNALAKKAMTYGPTKAQYKSMLLDFNDVRRLISDGLVSEVSDLDALKAYAAEETGEFAISIPQLEQMVASIKTITCLKGKSSKKVTAIKPICPKGYIKKK